MRITKEISWCMAHRLPNHNGKCKNIHGHDYKLLVTIEGCLNKTGPSKGMVLDFSVIKQILHDEIYSLFDHSLMIYENDKEICDLLGSTNLKIIYFPHIPTAENIASYCYYIIKSKLPSNIILLNCRVYETPTSFADFGNI